MATVTEVCCTEAGKRGDFFEVYVSHEGASYVAHLFVSHEGKATINKDVDGLGDWWDEFPQEVIDAALNAEFGERA